MLSFQPMTLVKLIHVDSAKHNDLDANSCLFALPFAA